MSENDEYFDESTYQISADDKNEINENIIQKRIYNRKQPKKPPTEAQKAAFQKARAKLLENQNARKSVPIKNTNIINRNTSVSQKPQEKQPIKRVQQNHRTINEPIDDNDYTDEENEEQFMITDTNNKNYIVRPVVKRIKQQSPPPKKRRTINNIKEKIDNKRLDNIVDTQINNIERSGSRITGQNALRGTSQQQLIKPQPQYVNMYTHTDALKPAVVVNKRNRSLLDDF